MNTRLAGLAAALCVFIAGCGGGGTSPGSPSVSGTLMDAPFRTSAGTVSAVYITIKKFEVIGSGGVQTVTTFSPATKVNLLDYQTSGLTLGTGQVPPGTYSQIRFILDTSSPDNTSMVLNGQTIDLSIPSATNVGFGGKSSTDNGDGTGTSGVKVNVSFTAQGSQTYAFLIDFNAAESIVQAGNSGLWLMKPVLVATAVQTSGNISGTVKNNAGSPVVNAQVVAEQGGTIVNSGVTDANGNFQINALPAGSYTIVVNNTWTSQAGASESASGADGSASVTYPSTVTVTGGQTTTINITD